MSMIAEIPGHEFNNYEINARQTKQVCGKSSLDDKIDYLTARLKGSGLMSRKLRSLTKANRAKAAFYELNLSLFRNKERGSHE